MKNWRTTLAGLLVGAASVAQSGASDWKSWAVGLGIVALGVFAKDAKTPANQ